MITLKPSFAIPLRALQIFSEEIPPGVMQFLYFSVIIGFIITSVLIINLNRRAFNYVMKDHAKSYWWLFAILAVIPLSLFLYAFTFLFGELLS